MEKEKIFFILFTFALVMSINIYSIHSEYPDTKPVISTYTNYVPTETVVVSPESGISEIEIKYPIDINFATKEELCSLKGIGNALSDKIIEYRKHNYFYSVEDITKVNGIGKKFLEENRDKITIDISKLPEITTTYAITEKTTYQITTASETPTTVLTTPEITEETEIATTKSETTTTETEITTTQTKKEIIPVNLNTATYEELVALPISPEVADEILDLRNKIGYFSSIRELCFIDSYSYELYIELTRYVYIE